MTKPNPAARTLGSHDFFQVDNVFVSKRFEDFHFPNGRDGKSVFFLLRVDALESNDFVGFSILPNENAPSNASTMKRSHVKPKGDCELLLCVYNKHTQKHLNIPVCALSDLMFLKKDIHVTEHYGSPNRNSGLTNSLWL